jgi:hypothetical protein
VAAVHGYGGGDPVTEALPDPTASAEPTPFVLPAAPAFPTSCSAAQPLAVPDGWPPMSLVGYGGGDPTGRYIVGRGYPGLWNDGPTYGALLWDNGVPIDLKVPGDEVVTEDVNTAGQVIINSWQGNGIVGYQYDDGTLTELAGSGEVRAINERGAIVGSVAVDTGEVDAFGLEKYLTRPALWGAAGAEPELLGPDDFEGIAIGIDDDGTILVFNEGRGTLTRVAPDGTLRDIVPPAGVELGQVRSYDNGWIVTRNEEAGGSGDLWHLDLDTPAQSLPDYGDALNANGWFAYSLNSLPTIGEPFTPEHTAFLGTPEGQQVELPALTGKYAGYALSPIYVSDDGHTVAGQGNDPTYSDPDADPIAIVWHCS